MKGCSVIRGFMVSTSNSTPMRSLVTACGAAALSKLSATAFIGLWCDRVRVDAERKGHGLAAPLDDLVADEREDVGEF